MSDPTQILDDPSQCTVDEQWHASTVILHCAGVIDTLTAPRLEQRIAAALAKAPTSMIVDLTLVDFLACRGMGVLVATHDLCSPTTDFAVVADGPVTKRPMQLIGLTDVLCVYARLDDALAGDRAG